MSPSATLSKSLWDLHLCWPPATCSFLNRLLKFTVQSASSLYPVHPSCSPELNQTASTACIPHLCPDSGLSRAWRRMVCHPVQGCRIQSCNCRSPAPTHQQHLSGHLRILSTGVTEMLLIYSRMTTALKNADLRMLPSASERTSYWGTQHSQTFICKQSAGFCCHWKGEHSSQGLHNWELRME